MFTPFMIYLAFMMDFWVFHNKVILGKIYPLIWRGFIITTPPPPNQLKKRDLALFQCIYVLSWVSDLKTEFQ